MFAIENDREVEQMNEEKRDCIARGTASVGRSTAPSRYGFSLYCHIWPVPLTIR